MNVSIKLLRTLNLPNAVYRMTVNRIFFVSCRRNSLREVDKMVQCINRIHVDQLGHIRPSNFLACEGKLKVFRVIFFT